MRKFLVLGLAGLFIMGCSSTGNVDTKDIVANKKFMNDCMHENYKEKENCVREETIARVGLVCKNVTVTGSRLPIRKCTTAAQREEKRLNAKLSLGEIQRGLQTTTTGETHAHNGF